MKPSHHEPGEGGRMNGEGVKRGELKAYVFIRVVDKVILSDTKA